MKRFQSYIQGLRCPHCAQQLQAFLAQQEGVVTAQVSFSQERVQLDYQPPLTEEALRQRIEQRGYSLWTLEAPPRPRPYRESALLLLALPYLFAMLFLHHLSMSYQILSASAAMILAYPIHRAAWQHRYRSMDGLISLGSSLVYGYSLWAAWRGEALYFETTVIMLGVLLWGQYLQQRWRREHLNPLFLLRKLLPETVERREHDAWQRIQLQQLKTGDVLRAQAGSRFAADGVVISGLGACDEAHLNGEAKSRWLQPDCAVRAGALLQSGVIEYRVEALPAASQLGQVMQQLETQGMNVPRHPSLADRISTVFMPLVAGLALLALALQLFFLPVHEALLRAVSALMLACPCALGLAVPSITMVLRQIAPRLGLRLHDSAVLEALPQVRDVVFDKTGTLTQGKPVLQAIDLKNHIDEASALALAAALEQAVHHPYAQAFQHHGMDLPEVSAVRYVAGCGLEAESAWGTVRLGRYDWAGLEPDAAWQAQWGHCTWLALSVAGQAWAMFAMSDALRPEIASLMTALRERGLRPHLLSGDRQQAVQHCAADLGMALWQAEARPEDKVLYIKNLQDEGRPVLFVGDGINDAPALRQADVGVALAQGSDAARFSAALGLEREDLSALLTLWPLAQRSRHAIKRQLFFALIYNLSALPLAWGGWISPHWAALLMSCSAFSVALSAFYFKKQLLREFKIVD